jgi:hypothetical protein
MLMPCNMRIGEFVERIVQCLLCYHWRDLRNALEAGGFEEGKISCSEKECFLKVSDLKRWAQLAWSYLGALPGG